MPEHLGRPDPTWRNGAQAPDNDSSWGIDVTNLRTLAIEAGLTGVPHRRKTWQVRLKRSFGPEPKATAGAGAGAVAFRSGLNELSPTADL